MEIQIQLCNKDPLLDKLQFSITLERTPPLKKISSPISEKIKQAIVQEATEFLLQKAVHFPALSQKISESSSTWHIDGKVILQDTIYLCDHIPH